MSEASKALTDFDLIYGIGNVGRQDDGLGWAFIDKLAENPGFSRTELIKHYQLHFEDVELIRHKNKILFVDATMEDSVSSFSFQTANQVLDHSIISHAISIPSILATCQICYQTVPETWVLAIRGYEWELSQGLTGRAVTNLQQAFCYFNL